MRVGNFCVEKVHVEPLISPKAFIFHLLALPSVDLGQKANFFFPITVQFIT